MIIGIDANEANVDNRVGVNRFAFEVIWGIYRQRKRSDQFLIFLKDQPKKDLPPDDGGWHYEVFGPKRLWVWSSLVKRLSLGKPRPDVLFTPSHYGPVFCRLPLIISVMDLGFLRWQDQFKKIDLLQLKHWTKWSVRKANRIIAISQSTKNDLIKTYGVEEEKVVVAYPGYLRSEKPDKDLKPKKIKIKGRYLLFLGTLKPSKNIEGLIEAFKLLTADDQFSDISLVIAGKKGWLYRSIFEKVKQSGLERRVVFTGFVSDKEAEALMKGAKVFIIPSFWEGFGIPALEAMNWKVPVVCSDRGALPEVVGRAALIVNPEKPAEIARAIEKGLTDEGLRKRLIKEGQKRIRLFSWQKCSKIVLETIYETRRKR